MKGSSEKKKKKIKYSAGLSKTSKQSGKTVKKTTDHDPVEMRRLNCQTPGML